MSDNKTTDQINQMQQHAEDQAYLLAVGLNKITDLELEIKNLKKLLTGDMNETTKRAIQLKEFVEIKGLVTTRQVQNVLGNCHRNIAIRSMEKAAELYGYVHFKNDNGKWVLSA